MGQGEARHLHADQAPVQQAEGHDVLLHVPEVLHSIPVLDPGSGYVDWSKTCQGGNRWLSSAVGSTWISN